MAELNIPFTWFKSNCMKKLYVNPCIIWLTNESRNKRLGGEKRFRMKDYR